MLDTRHTILVCTKPRYENTTLNPWSRIESETENSKHIYVFNYWQKSIIIGSNCLMIRTKLVWGVDSLRGAPSPNQIS